MANPPSLGEPILLVPRPEDCNLAEHNELKPQKDLL